MTGQPARLQPGDLLAALGELTPGRAAEAYAALGYRVVAMHAVRGDGGCTCQRGTRCSDPGKHPCLAGWPRAASRTPAEVRGWWQRWPQANAGLVTETRFDVLDLDGPEGGRRFAPSSISATRRSIPGRLSAPAGAAGTCCTRPPGWATG
jgi:hypothetical protein